MFISISQFFLRFLFSNVPHSEWVDWCRPHSNKKLITRIAGEFNSTTRMPRARSSVCGQSSRHLSHRRRSSSNRRPLYLPPPAHHDNSGSLLGRLLIWSSLLNCLLVRKHSNNQLSQNPSPSRAASRQKSLIVD